MGRNEANEGGSGGEEDVGEEKEGKGRKGKCVWIGGTPKRKSDPFFIVS